MHAAGSYKRDWNFAVPTNQSQPTSALLPRTYGCPQSPTHPEATTNRDCSLPARSHAGKPWLPQRNLAPLDTNNALTDIASPLLNR